MKNPRLLASTALLFLTALTACGSSADHPEEPLGEASFAVTTVPATVQCIELTVTGATTVSKSLAVTPGASSATLSLGELPLGPATVTGQAFNVACASIASASPSYIADPLSVTLRAGVVSSLPLTFRPDNGVAATASFVGDVTDFSLSAFASYFVMSDGTVQSAGYEGYGTASASLAPLAGFTGVTQMAGGLEFACAVTTAGSVYCAGANGSGQLGNGTTTSTTAPVQVTGITSAVHVTAGQNHACALEKTGAVYCWGDNSFGELGNNTTTSSSTPVLVGLDQPITSLTAGDAFTCAPGGQGAVLCWGQNTAGQLGNGTTTNSALPVVVGPASSPLDATIAVAAGGSTACALRADGTVRCWGQNTNGELGNGTTTSSSAPVVVNVSGVTQIAASSDAVCALGASSVSCWGNNASGELGNGTGVSSSVPVMVAALAGAPIALRSGGTAWGFCAQTPALTVDCWGFNQDGQFGNGTSSSAFTPTLVQQ